MSHVADFVEYVKIMRSTYRLATRFTGPVVLDIELSAHAGRDSARCSGTKAGDIESGPRVWGLAL
jgi:hypothetical protein